jgi:hypothetical protein
MHSEVQRENTEITGMIYNLDIRGIEKRIRKYRFGKYVCFVLFLIVSAYFAVLKITEGYPVDVLAVFMPLLISGVLWYRERDLMKAREIMVETLVDLSEKQNQTSEPTAPSGRGSP